MDERESIILRTVRQFAENGSHYPQIEGSTRAWAYSFIDGVQSRIRLPIDLRKYFERQVETLKNDS